MLRFTLTLRIVNKVYPIFFLEYPFLIISVIFYYKIVTTSQSPSPLSRSVFELYRAEKTGQSSLCKIAFLPLHSHHRRTFLLAFLLCMSFSFSFWLNTLTDWHRTAEQCRDLETMNEKYLGFLLSTWETNTNKTSLWLIDLYWNACAACIHTLFLLCFFSCCYPFSILTVFFSFGEKNNEFYCHVI